jgi:hypothetical protein
MRLPRFTTRRLMVLVAVAGLAMGVALELRRRSEFFQRIAQAHAERAVENLWGILGPDADSASRKYVYHNGLSQKYKRAARYPWLPVPPDPPPPE